MKLIHILGLIGVLVMLTAQGCQTQPEVAPTPTPEPEPEPEPVVVAPEPEPVVAQGADVAIIRGAFDPETVTIKAGSSVTWKNMDVSVHLLVIGADRSPRLVAGTPEFTIEHQDGTTEKGGPLPGGIWEKEFTEVGEYNVIDAISKFRGKVIVTE